MDPQQLQSAIASAQAGSGQAFAVLLEAYGPRLYGYFMRATGNHHDAEDLVGEMQLRLVGQLKSYDHRGRFEPWLFRVAANMVRDRIRRRKVRPVTIEGSTQDEGSILDQQASPQTAVEAPLIVQETLQRVNIALGQLDDMTKETILLRHFAQLSFKEIAQVQDCPVGTVLARAHRGLRKLRKLIGEDDV